MSGRRSWWQSGCITALGCLGAVALGLVVVVRAVIAWITGHAWVVWMVVGMAAAGGALGGWLATLYEVRQQRRHEN